MKVKLYTSEDELTEQYWFFCPGCRTHHALTTKAPKGPIWTFNGDLNRPTFRASLLCDYGEGKVCHSFITDGKIEFLNDCYHELKGTTVEMEEVEKTED